MKDKASLRDPIDGVTAALVSKEFQEYRKGIGAVPAAEGI